MKYLSIAIDGPSGAGKSTFAKRLAADLNFLYVDTGAIYRSVALYILSSGIDLDDIPAVIKALPNIAIDISYDSDGLQRMVLCGQDVTSEIRTPKISAGASKVSAIGEVRSFLLETQREFARCHNVIMDGRDIGTVVLPGADLKIFLTASPESRALRRYKEFLEKGVEISLEKVREDMAARDKNDSSRAAAPLKKADDAVIIDTTDLSLEESYKLIRTTVKDSLGI